MPRGPEVRLEHFGPGATRPASPGSPVLTWLCHGYPQPRTHPGRLTLLVQPSQFCSSSGWSIPVGLAELWDLRERERSMSWSSNCLDWCALRAWRSRAKITRLYPWGHLDRLSLKSANS